MTEGNSHILLRDWNVYNRRILIAPGDSLRVALENPQFSTEQSGATGWFCVKPMYSAAVYVNNQRLKLQIGTRIFDWIDDKVMVSHKCRGTHVCRATLWQGWQRILQLTYRSVASKMIAIGDMTFDPIDEEMEDWWLWLSLQTRNKRERAEFADFMARGMPIP